MTNTILITANWHTGALSQQTISRQYDNNRYAVRFVGYPEASDGNELDYYLLVWMSTAPGQKPGEITPIQLNSDQWYISNYFTQQVQVIKFQLCVLNEAGTYEAHSPIFSGRIGDSLEHNGTSHDIDVSTLFDAYREYVEELIIGAGAVIIDPTPTQGSTNAVSSGGVYDKIDSLKSDLDDVELSAFTSPISYSKITAMSMWTNGQGVREETGSGFDNEKYCRSVYVPIEKPTILYIDSANYEFNCWCYSGDNISSATYAPRKKYGSDLVIISTKNSTIYFRIGVRRKDGAVMSTNDITVLTSAVKTFVLADDTLTLANVPADAKAVGDLSPIRRSIGAETDFNNVTVSGYYGLSNVTYQNAPDGYGTSGGVLIVYNYYGTIYITQMLISYRSLSKSIKMYVRSGKVGSDNPWWNNWVECSNPDNAITLVDKLWRIATTGSSTSHGITFVLNAINNEITMNGTWDGESVCHSSIVTYEYTQGYFKNNTPYYVDVNCADKNAVVEIYYNDVNNVTTKIGAFNSPTQIVFPEEANTYLVRIRYTKANYLVSNLKMKLSMYELNSVTNRVIGAHLINNQRIAMFGDSMMSGTIKTPSTNQTRCVGRYIQNELKIPVDDVSMGSIGYITHGHLSYNILELAKSVDLTGCTYFICCAGDNDGAYPIGDYTDTNNEYPDYDTSTSGATVMGNIYKLTKYLHETYDNMTVIYISKPNAITSGVFPTYRRTDGTWIRQFNDELKKFCDYYGCGYINMFENAGIDGWLLQQIVEPDGVHFKLDGYRKLSLFIAEELKKFTGIGDYYTDDTNKLIDTSPLVT